MRVSKFIIVLCILTINVIVSSHNTFKDRGEYRLRRSSTAHVPRKADEDLPRPPPPPKKPSPPSEDSSSPTGAPTNKPNDKDDEWSGGDKGEEDAAKKKEGGLHILQTNSENQTTLFGMSRTASLSLMSVFFAVILFSLGGGVYKYASSMNRFTQLATNEEKETRNNEGNILPVVNTEEALGELGVNYADEQMISKKRSFLREREV